MTAIDSPSNARLKDLRRLARSAHARRESGTLLVEGARGVLAALANEGQVEVVLFCPELCRSEAVRARVDALEHWPGAPAPAVWRLSTAAFTSLSRREGPTGIAAVVAWRTRPLDALPTGADAIVVVARDLADPGNLGTILRTLDAAGGAGLVLMGDGGTDASHPQAVKASMGAVFSVPVAEAGWPEVLAWARGRGVTLVATSARAEREHWEDGGLQGLTGPVALVLGSERHGLTPEMLAAADRRVRIPLAGTVSSLNVAVAAAILVYELRRGSRR